MSIWHEITQGVKAVVDPGPGRFVAGALPGALPSLPGRGIHRGFRAVSTVGISFAHLNWATERKSPI